MVIKIVIYFAYFENDLKQGQDLKRRMMNGVKELIFIGDV
jgi:hypothetical protein